MRLGVLVGTKQTSVETTMDLHFIFSIEGLSIRSNWVVSGIDEILTQCSGALDSTLADKLISNFVPTLKARPSKGFLVDLSSDQKTPEKAPHQSRCPCGCTCGY